MVYRLKQLFNALFPKIKNHEYLWINYILNEKEQQLFRSQTLAEQRHALDVAYDIQNDKTVITAQHGEYIYACLLKAALLHDCGKSIIGLSIGQRIFIVIFCYLPVRIQCVLKRNATFNQTILIYERHPAWGKRLVAQIGACLDIQNFIKNHHHPITETEKILFSADNRH